jgi:hypothetical protein
MIDMSRSIESVNNEASQVSVADAREIGGRDAGVLCAARTTNVDSNSPRRDSSQTREMAVTDATCGTVPK